MVIGRQCTGNVIFSVISPQVASTGNMERRWISAILGHTDNGKGPPDNGLCGFAISRSLSLEHLTSCPWPSGWACALITTKPL